MARRLVTARDMYQHPDQSVRDAGNAIKGLIVRRVDDGHEFSPLEGLPDFVVIDTPGELVSGPDAYELPLLSVIDYTIVNSSPSLDGFRVDVFTTNKTASGKGQLTLAQVDAYLTSWGATIVNVNSTRVRFDFSIYGLLSSSQMLGHWPQVTLAEDSYDSVTGDHVLTVTYINAPLPPKAVTEAERIVQQFGGTVNSSTPGAINFTMNRSDVINYFKLQTKEALERVVLLRQYRFDPAFIDTAIAAGGVLSVTPAQAIANLIDRATE